MDESDLKYFSETLGRMANLFCKAINADEVESYFDYLKDYSLDTIQKAIRRALDDRDPNDLYLKNALVSALEIKIAADAVLAEQRMLNRLKIGCEKCNMTGFILVPDSTGYKVAKRCDCFMEILKAKKMEGK